MENVSHVILRDKLAAGEVSEAALGRAYAAYLRATREAPFIVGDADAWVAGFLGFASDVFDKQDGKEG